MFFLTLFLFRIFFCRFSQTAAGTASHSMGKFSVIQRSKQRRRRGGGTFSLFINLSLLGAERRRRRGWRYREAKKEEEEKTAGAAERGKKWKSAPPPPPPLFFFLSFHPLFLLSLSRRNPLLLLPLYQGDARQQGTGFANRSKHGYKIRALHLVQVCRFLFGKSHVG